MRVPLSDPCIGLIIDHLQTVADRLKTWHHVGKSGFDPHRSV